MSDHFTPLRTKNPVLDTHLGAQITCHPASYLWVSFHTLSFLTCRQINSLNRPQWRGHVLPATVLLLGRQVHGVCFDRNVCGVGSQGTLRGAWEERRSVLEGPLLGHRDS